MFHEDRRHVGALLPAFSGNTHRESIETTVPGEIRRRRSRNDSVQRQNGILEHLKPCLEILILDRNDDRLILSESEVFLTDEGKLFLNSQSADDETQGNDKLKNNQNRSEVPHAASASQYTASTVKNSDRLE